MTLLLIALLASATWAIVRAFQNRPAPYSCLAIWAGLTTLAFRAGHALTIFTAGVFLWPTIAIIADHRARRRYPAEPPGRIHLHVRFIDPDDQPGRG